MHGKKCSYKEVKTTRRGIEDVMKENREEYMLMGGDFNGRIGERGAGNWEEERRWEKKNQRQTKDKENAEERKLIERIEENGWEVLNRNKQRDEEGGWTYVGSRGETVIDYGIVNEEAWERVEELRIEERAESDHLEVALRKRRRRKEQRRKRVEIGIKLFIFIFLE
jgi:exonuclease III